MKIEISVLMSIFNEKKIWIQESIESILSQTIENFELIIIVDNPIMDKEIEKYLTYIGSKYKNIIIIKNNCNIGLALSLNKGLKIARGEYIIRMDADDVCDRYRFAKQLAFLKSNKFDMIFTNKNIIDESSNIVQVGEPYKFTSTDLPRILELYNCVIHPTVLVKKSILVELGGYRNFKQAQDYDLWLRMLSKGAKIGVLDEALINYRVRNNSISHSKALLQFLTGEYQKKLYLNRKKRGYDNFSEEKFNEYLNKYKAFDVDRNKKFVFACNELNRGLNLIKEKKISGIFFVLKGFIINYNSIKKFMITLRYKKIVRK